MYSFVGKPTPRIDSPMKATGEAKYTDDLVLSRMLYGKILRSPHPHAKVLHIDTTKAKRLPGVKAIITGEDTPKIKHALTPETEPDQYPLALEKVRYIGDEVAALAAIDEDMAEEALELIQVEYEIMPHVFNPEEAMETGAPKIHDVDRNISSCCYMNYGDVDRGFQESDYVREDNFTTQATAHCALEPHAALASFDLSSNKLTVWLGSGMGIFSKRYWLAKTLAMAENDVRVIMPRVGGAFGGKIDLFCCDFSSALLSKITGRPVKIVYTREEVFATTRQRHPMIIKIKTGVKKDGTLVARDVRLIADNGAYKGSGPVAIFLSGVFLLVTYRVPNLRYEGFSVYTNKSVRGPQRSHGHLQPRFAEDSQLDMIAEELGIDPLEMRIKNARRLGDILPNKSRLISCALTDCLQKGADNAHWKEKRGRRRDKRGIGIAATSFASGYPVYPFASAALIEIHTDGGVSLLTGSIDIGQGSDTILAQIAAEELGLRPSEIKIVSADTEICPIDISSYLSGLTYFTGNAVKMAAADARQQLFEVVASKLEVSIEDLEVRDKMIYVKGSPEKGMSFAQAVMSSILERKGNPIWGKGYYKPDLAMNFKTGEGPETPTYSFGAQVGEVEVDKETGQVKLIQITTAGDCGFPINPMGVEQQIEGSASMAQGQALYEDLLWDKGQLLNPSLGAYKAPLATETPVIKALFINSIDPEGPYGAKEAGETFTPGVAPAIANAIYDAIGIRVRELPITPEKILKALEEKNSE